MQYTVSESGVSVILSIDEIYEIRLKDNIHQIHFLWLSDIKT